MDEVSVHTKNLPTHWKWAKLGDVCAKVETVKRKEKNPEEELIYLDIGGLDNETNKIHNHKNYKWRDAPSRAQQIVYKNDVLFSTVRTYMKNIALVENNIYHGQIASSGFCVIRGEENIANPKFLFYYAVSEKFLRPLNELQTGSSYPAVRDKDVFSQPFPLAPIEIQQQIVFKIEELFSEIDKGIEEIKTAQQQLRVYRQAVLKWGFEGKLTNASVKEGELPIGWKRNELKTLVDKISDGPFGSHLKSNDYVEAGIRVIRLENIGELEFKDEYKTYVTIEKYETIKNHTVAKGDIIFSSFISENIRTTILPEFIEKAINKADCFLIRTSGGQIDKKYLVYFLSSKELYNQLVKHVHGATRPRINTTQLKAVSIPTASLAEQQQIVQEIESRLSVCDKIEETITNSLKQAEALRQSILKKAFEGKLI